MTYLSHERALFARISKADGNVPIQLKTCPTHTGYELLRVPTSVPGCAGFGVALVHSLSESVPFCAQVSVFPAVAGAGRLTAHVLSRRSPEYEHRGAQTGLIKSLLLEYLACQYDLVLSRAGMDWHHWLSMLSMLSARGMSTYAPRWPGQKLEQLDAEDLREQNEDIGEVLMALEPGIVIASWDADLAGKFAHLDESVIEQLDSAWREFHG